MNGLADLDGFKICIQVCVWLGFPPLLFDGMIYSVPCIYWHYVQTSHFSDFLQV